MTEGSLMKADGKGLVGNGETGPRGPREADFCRADRPAVCVCLYTYACVLEPKF